MNSEGSITDMGLRQGGFADDIVMIEGSEAKLWE